MIYVAVPAAFAIGTLFAAVGTYRDRELDDDDPLMRIGVAVTLLALGLFFAYCAVDAALHIPR